MAVSLSFFPFLSLFLLLPCSPQHPVLLSRAPPPCPPPPSPIARARALPSLVDLAAARSYPLPSLTRRSGAEERGSDGAARGHAGPVGRATTATAAELGLRRPLPFFPASGQRGSARVWSLVAPPLLPGLRACCSSKQRRPDLEGAGSSECREGQRGCPTVGAQGQGRGRGLEAARSPGRRQCELEVLSCPSCSIWSLIWSPASWMGLNRRRRELRAALVGGRDRGGAVPLGGGRRETANHRVGASLSTRRRRGWRVGVGAVNSVEGWSWGVSGVRFFAWRALLELL
jgi:hypothetical protein